MWRVSRMCLAVDHPNLFPQAAVVFCSISAQTLSRFPMTNRMTGVAYRFVGGGELTSPER